MRDKENYKIWYHKNKNKMIERRKKERKETNGKIDKKYYNKYKDKINKKRNEKRLEIKQFCVKHKGGKCCICGYNKSLNSLDFHHLNPSEKEFNISRKINEIYKLENSKEELIKELDKCILVCKNCHGEIYRGITQYEHV